MKHSQHGFTLVELMVAMAIGTVIILGAGQLFLTTFQTFKAVDELSRKQESLIFIMANLVQDIRSADNIFLGANGVVLEVSVMPLEDVCDEDVLMEKQYFLTETNEKFSLNVKRKCNDKADWSNSEPLVEGFYDDSDESFSVEGLGRGLYKLRIRLMNDAGQRYEEFAVLIKNRSEVF
tara:strand:+ start:1225 stop:1758 length:534 start_codon:yes stop_codon:yes gene_type:complete